MSKEEQMRALFDEWRASAKPRATFARERNVPINTFHYWCQRFEGKRRPSRSKAVQSQPAFVEIAASPSPPSSVSQHPAAGQSRTGQPRMRFELADGTVITVF